MDLKPALTARKPPIVITLIIIAVIVTLIAYNALQASLEMPKAENLVIKDVKIDRKRSLLIGVEMANIGEEAISIVRLDLVKIQAKKVVYSLEISPPIKVDAGETRIVSLSAPLDPEGADYKVILITAEKRASSYIFGYTAPGK